VQNINMLMKNLINTLFIRKYIRQTFFLEVQEVTYSAFLETAFKFQLSNQQNQSALILEETRF
jgi:hypothetical protein